MALSTFARELFTGMIRESGMPVTEPEMRAEWELLNQGEGSLIRNDSNFSPFWRLITAIVTRPALWLVTLLIEHVLPNSFLRFAEDVYLDVYAWGVHLTRKTSARLRGRVIFTRAGTTGEPVALSVTIHAVPEADERRRERLLTEAEARIRCAFRQNTGFQMTKTFPLSRFSFSRLGDELHTGLPDLESVEFHRGEDIVSVLSLPRLDSLEIRLGGAASARGAA